jgi:ESS family glutamate:Na+ symporter
MTPFAESMLILFAILLGARFLKRQSTWLKKLFIPSSLLAGLIGLTLGPQVLVLISSDTTKYWAMLPKYLIIVVFAGLFLGKHIPSRKEIWRTASSQIAFGNTLAWGQYVIGIGLTMLILTPLFNTPPIAGALIEISFEGGHGTSAGLAPVFDKLGWSAGTDIALALATLSIFAAVISGILIVNWQKRKIGTVDDEEEWERQQRRNIRSGYNLYNLGTKIVSSPGAIIRAIGAYAVAIGVGWVMYQLLIWGEAMTLDRLTDLRFMPYVPFFPFAMVGGLIVQFSLHHYQKQHLVRRRIAEVIASIALDVLIASAIATVSLNAIATNWEVFVVLGVAGIVWILFSFFWLAPRMFSNFWFEKGLTNIGQSMGTTATGFMFQRLVDPSNTSGARESFSYKQLVFEPFLGGGIITATSLVVIYELGSTFALITALIVFVFWLIVGFKLGKRTDDDKK